MRVSSSLGLAGLVTLFLATSSACAAEKPALELTDEGLPIQEIRPLDRHVYILTFDGKWNRPAKDGVKYYVNVFYPNGQSSAHRVIDEAMFPKGDIRCVLQEYELIRNDVAKGGELSIVISEGQPAASDTAKEVISDVLKVTWPTERPIVTRAPRTRHTPAAPIDALSLPDDPLLKYNPKPKKP